VCRDQTDGDRYLDSRFSREATATSYLDRPEHEGGNPLTELYNKARSLTALEPHYSRHVSAMTSEGLHSKSDIAVELAFRDQEIARLRAALEAVRGVAADRERFVMQGPRGFMAAVRIVDDALGEQGGK
jgi:hypothetical protein